MTLKKTAWFGAIVIVASAAYAQVSDQAIPTAPINTKIITNVNSVSVNSVNVNSVNAAKALAAADRAQTNTAPACFQLAANVFCPIVGRIPVIRKFAGQMAMLTGTTCPING